MIIKYFYGCLFILSCLLLGVAFYYKDPVAIFIALVTSLFTGYVFVLEEVEK